MKKNKKKSPSVFAQKLLAILLPESERSSLMGDYEELFKDIFEEKNRIIAVSWYWFQIIINLPFYFFDSIKWSFIMIKNYLKVTVRSLLKNKGFSIINITGLATSMAICLMIVIFIKDQKSSDKFHENKDRIVRIYTTDEKLGWDVDGWATTPGSVVPYLQSNFSFIEDAVRMKRMWGSVLNTGTAVSISGLYVESSFFDVFSFSLKEGDQKTALKNPDSIVLSEETAFKFFGDQDPMNKSLTFENFGDFTVTGILKTIDQKSHFKFDALVSFSTLPSLLSKNVLYKSFDSNSWESYKEYYTYVLLQNKKDLSEFKDQLASMANTLIPSPENERYGFKLQTLLSINLGKNLINMMPGTKPRLDIFFIPFLAILVMFLACFNYIIMSIARSLKRTKEIGLRKVIGSKRNEIVRLFLSETFIVTFLSLIVACLILLWLIPIFNGIDAIESTKNQINIELMKDPSLYLIFILFAFGVAIIAGLYPALYLSSFQPANALQGLSKIKGFSHLLTRKILLATQFAVSLTSVIFIVYFYQLHLHWVTYDRRMAIENFVSVPLQDVNYKTFKNEILQNSDVTSVSFSNDIPIYGGGGGILKIKMDNDEELRHTKYYCVDPNFIRDFEISLIAGRNFSDEYSTDIQNAAILNETAVQVLGFQSPENALGKIFTLEDGTNISIIGIVKDFYFRKFFKRSIEPLALLYRPDKFRYANVKYFNNSGENIKASLPQIWKKFDDVHPVYCRFFNDEQQEIDSQMTGTLNISIWACGFVILISLFGLLGMATYTTELRVKEIGIRKVLGSSVYSAAFLLAKDYVKLILYAAVIAMPSGYFLAQVIYQAFSIRPGISLWVPPVALIFILSLALITIGSQTIKAAFTNPSDTLRVE